MAPMVLQASNISHLCDCKSLLNYLPLSTLVASSFLMVQTHVGQILFVFCFKFSTGSSLHWEENTCALLWPSSPQWSDLCPPLSHFLYKALQVHSFLKAPTSYVFFLESSLFTGSVDFTPSCHLCLNSNFTSLERPSLTTQNKAHIHTHPIYFLINFNPSTYHCLLSFHLFIACPLPLE